jgi:hypothetical protein
MKTGFVLAISIAALFALGSQAPAAEIIGQVVDATGRPVSGVQIQVEDASGRSVGQAVSDSTGEYGLGGLGEGTYSLSANGQSAVTYVGHGGVTVNWGVSGNSWLATARPGLVAPGSGADLPLASSHTLAPISLIQDGDDHDCDEGRDDSKCDCDNNRDREDPKCECKCKCDNDRDDPKKCKKSPYR